MKELEQLIQRGGVLEFPHKNKINEYYGEIILRKALKEWESGGEFVVQDQYLRLHFHDTFEAAYKQFSDIAYSHKNHGYIQNRLNEKGLLTDESDFDLSRPNSELKNMFKAEAKLIRLENEKL